MAARRDERGISLLELMFAGAILAIVLAVVGSYLVSASRTVAQGSAHAADNAAAQSALTFLDGDIRFACAVSISTSPAALYVENSNGSTCVTSGEPACAVWSVNAAKELVEKISATGSGTVIARGVSNLRFSTPSNSGGTNVYYGLVTVSFTLSEPQYQSNDASGVAVDETITARNMSSPVGSTPVCTPS